MCGVPGKLNVDVNEFSFLGTEKTESNLEGSGKSYEQGARRHQIIGSKSQLGNAKP